MEYEIRNCNLGDIPQLKVLWAEVFHDEPRFIDHFFESAFSIHNGFVCLNEDKPIAMMFMLPARLKMGTVSLDAGYLYAVATKQEYRGKGIMSEMERYVSEQAVLRGISVLCLVPATESLFKLYQKSGYQTAFYRATTIITPTAFSQGELLNCRLDYFLAEREAMLSGQNASLELDVNYQKYRYETLKMSGEILIYKDDFDDGYIVGYKKENHYIILETNMSMAALPKAAAAINEKYYKLKKISLLGKSGRRASYGMLKSLDKEVNIFELKKMNPYMNLMLE